jgi:hypothetical protein
METYGGERVAVTAVLHDDRAALHAVSVVCLHWRRERRCATRPPQSVYPSRPSTNGTAVTPSSPRP